jgi:hypothetical protein
LPSSAPDPHVQRLAIRAERLAWGCGVAALLFLLGVPLLGGLVSPATAGIMKVALAGTAVSMSSGMVFAGMAFLHGARSRSLLIAILLLVAPMLISLVFGLYWMRSAQP